MGRLAGQAPFYVNTGATTQTQQAPGRPVALPHVQDADMSFTFASMPGVVTIAQASS
jgi:hypothetical protein